METSDRPDASKLFYDLVPSPLGELFVATGSAGLIALEFHPDGGEAERLATARGTPITRSPEALAPVAAQLADYFAGRRLDFDLPLDLGEMSDFQREVLSATARIPLGRTMTYGEIARELGKPGASQAVGQALGRNPIPIVIPCHRVVAGGSDLGGYSGRGGLETKRALLLMEGVLLL